MIRWIVTLLNAHFRLYLIYADWSDHWVNENAIWWAGEKLIANSTAVIIIPESHFTKWWNDFNGIWRGNLVKAYKRRHCFIRAKCLVPIVYRHTFGWVRRICCCSLDDLISFNWKTSYTQFKKKTNNLHFCHFGFARKKSIYTLELPQKKRESKQKKGVTFNWFNISCSCYQTLLCIVFVLTVPASSRCASANVYYKLGIWFSQISCITLSYTLYWTLLFAVWVSDLGPKLIYRIVVLPRNQTIQ